MISIRCGFYFAVVAVALLLVDIVSGLGCPICRSYDRPLLNPGHKFTMKNGQGQTADWTCGFLEESVEDVNPANEGEGFFCALAQTWAERECSCGGPPITPFQDQVIDPNPKCNMCVDDRTVPFIQREELVQTGIAGRMACGGLYDALARGVLPAYLCPDIQRNTADFCCEVPVLVAPDGEGGNEPAGGGGGGTPTPTCGGMYDTCGSAECCSEFDCKLRVLGEDPVCSAKPRAVKTSLSEGRGGAGAAAKFAV